MSEHQFIDPNTNECLVCGIKRDSDQAALPCIKPALLTGLRPEPAERRYGVNDFDAIRARMDEIKKEAEV